MSDYQTPQENELTSHNYDGIQEYDNPIPGWWHLIFLGSVIFSVCYVVVFHMTPLVPSREVRLERKIAAAEEVQFGKLRQLPMNDIKLQTIMGNEQWLSSGKSIYAGTCAVCHGQQAQGIEGLGYNLTDEKFVNVQNMMDIVGMIQNGSENKKMPPQTTLNTNEVAMVAAYVASIRGTNVQGPQSMSVGDPIEPFPAPISEDAGG